MTIPTGDHSSAAIPCASCGRMSLAVRTFGSPSGPYSLCFRCGGEPAPAVTLVEIKQTARPRARRSKR